MKDITINIPDMQSPHCQLRVRAAVSTLEGVQIQNLKAGEITVSLSSDSQKDEVVKAVNKAGYTSSSDNNV